MRAIETSVKLGHGVYTLAWLRQNQVEIVIRYISRGGGSKCIDANELTQLLDNDYTVGIVYEFTGGDPHFGGLPGNIDAEQGKKDGDYALATLKTLGVPKNTVVYFGVDTDVTTNNETN